MNDQVNTYISDCLSRGIPKETIKNNLVAVGWKGQEVDIFLSSHPDSNSATFSLSALAKKAVRINISSLLLRIGLAFVFTYAAISLSLNPAQGMNYVPKFVTTILPASTFLSLFGIFEIILSLWLLSGKLSKYSGLLSALTIFGITALNLESFGVLFRNVAIFFAGLSLATMQSFDRERKLQ